MPLKIRNVLKFQVDYFKPEGKTKPNPGEPLAQPAVVDAILTKHEAVTNSRRFNAILATASINDAIAYYNIFKQVQVQRKLDDESFALLNIACVFSPPAEGNKDVEQLQEDLQQEKLDNEEKPEEKKLALKSIINDYNVQYKTNHTIGEFDIYYKDVQQRIKSQRYPNSDIPHSEKIDILIVIDMLLTGFDAQYLNTLYVDKKLKYHGLIQAFSRTNRILNRSKPQGNILDFRQQRAAVDEAIELFSGQDKERAKEIWLVEPAPAVIGKYEKAVTALNNFMQSRGLACKPEEVHNLKGDTARAEFVNHFKEIQRLKTQLDQYTDLTTANISKNENLLPHEQLRSFKSAYIETAKRLKEKQQTGGDDDNPAVQQLDFEFVLFASAVIDYDYIMGLIAKYTQGKPSKQKMTKEQLVNILCSDAKFMDEREDIIAYINSLELGTSRNTIEIEQGYQNFKKAKTENDLATIAQQYGLQMMALKSFVESIISRMIFDAEQLNDLLAPLGLGWKDRAKKEQALMKELIPQLNKLAQGREISGLKAYE